jgi:2-aminomuconate deaminase
MTGGRVVPGHATPRGRFPHVKLAGGFAFVSGTSARRPDNSIAGARVDPDGTTTLDIRAQTRAVIENIRGLLREVGADLPDLVQVTAYLVSMNDFGGYNQVWAEYFDERGPTRTTVAVHQLPHPHLLVEMQAVAAVPGGTGGVPGGVGGVPGGVGGVPDGTEGARA